MENCKATGLHIFSEKRKKQGGKSINLDTKDIILLLIALIIVLLFFYVHSTYIFDHTTEPIGITNYVFLDSKQYIEQRITGFEEKTLFAINIQFGTNLRKNEGKIILSLSKDNEIIEKWNIPSAGLYDNAYKTFELHSPVMLTSESNYIFRIEEEYQGENDVAIPVNTEKDSNYNINGEADYQGSICYTLTYRNSNLKTKYIIIGIVMCLLVTGAIIFGIKDTIIMAVILAVLMTCYMWLCPLGMAPDEASHFRRAYEIANVSLLSQHLGENGEGGNRLPNAVNAFKNENAEIDWNDTSEIKFGNTALYAPISYLPQAAGIRITQLFTNKAASIFRGGRFGNALVSFILCLCAIYMIPFGKKIIFLLMTFPLSLQEMISMAPDGFVISLSIFFLAYIIRLAYVNKQVKIRDIVILSLTGTTISLLKIVYVVLLFLILIIPQEKFKTRKTGTIFKVGLISAACLLNLIWMKISFGYMVEFNTGVDASAQVKYVLLNAFEFLGISIRTFIYNSSSWISNMISSEMGALNIGTTAIVWISIAILFVYEILNCFPAHISYQKKDPIILLSVFIIGSALVFSSLYVQWTPLENNIINGIQGRYFTPLMGSFAFAIVLFRQGKLTSQNTETNFYEKGRYIYLLILLFNGIILLDMTKYYLMDLW